MRPTVSSFSGGLGVVSAIAKPLYITTINPKRIVVVPISPSSSPMAEKIKSVSTAGIRSGFPSPRPVPDKPPSAKAKEL